MPKIVGNYRLGKTLGQGAFSKVKKAVNIKTNEAFAMKIIDRVLIVENHLERQLEREIDVMSRMKHPNIIRLHEIMKSERNIYLALDLAEGGELFNKLAQDGPLEERTARKYFQQLIDALEYMHAQGAIHRDLKPENLLLDKNDNLKIADFGLSIIAQSDNEMLKTRCGTPNYVAPCVFYSDSYAGPPADLWSAGLILYVMLVAAIPFDAPNLKDLARKIMNVDIYYPPTLPAGAKDLMTKIVVADPKKRYTLAQVKAHPWFAVDYRPSLASGGVNECSKSAVEIQREPEPEPEAPAELSAFELFAKISPVNVGKLVDNSINVNASTSFTTSKETEDVLAIINNSLSKLRGNVTMMRNEPSIKALVPVGTQSVSVRVDVSKIAPGINLVEFCRLKGFQFDFLRVYRTCKHQLQ